jgi:hypothetical protein
LLAFAGQVPALGEAARTGIVMVALDELMAASPMSIAPGVVVVTAGTVRLESAVALAAVAAGASSGLAWLTPE